MTTATAVRQLVFEISACDGHFRYTVVFDGEDASAKAMHHILCQDERHRREDGLGQIVWHLVEEQSDDGLISEELAEFLWPTCEHGLSLSLCAGPGHYPTEHPYQ